MPFRPDEKVRVSLLLGGFFICAGSAHHIPATPPAPLPRGNAPTLRVRVHFGQRTRDGNQDPRN